MSGPNDAHMGQAVKQGRRLDPVNASVGGNADCFGLEGLGYPTVLQSAPVWKATAMKVLHR
jgi:hypothetical protein